MAFNKRSAALVASSTLIAFLTTAAVIAVQGPSTSSLEPGFSAEVASTSSVPLGDRQMLVALVDMQRELFVVNRATALTTLACMSAEGFDWEEELPDVPHTADQQILPVDDGYMFPAGFEDSDPVEVRSDPQAAQRSLVMSTCQSESLNEVLGSDVPEDALFVLANGVMAGYNQSVAELEASPAYISAVQSWSRCMEDRTGTGHSSFVDAILHAVGDRPMAPGLLETPQGAIDRECRREAGFDTSIAALRSEIEERAYADHREAIEEWNQFVEAVRPTLTEFVPELVDSLME